MSLKIIVPPHPLIAHWLTMLRDVSTPPPIYSTAFEQLGKWLTYEAIREWLPTRKDKIRTSQGSTEGIVIEYGIPILAIPHLPAGLHLWEGAKELLPNANLCLGGIPSQVEDNSGLIIYLDQITEGKTLISYLSILKEKNIHLQRIKIISAIAASPGLKKLAESFPDLTIYTACIDPEINPEGDIVPGIGNPTKRINTRITSSN